MLTHFPMPLPDEWWYSVLCRYYISAGVQEHGIVKKELFGRADAHMGTLFPNGSLAAVVNRLPRTVFCFQDVLLNNTPFKYYVRFYPKGGREYLMKYLSEGGTPQLTHLWRSYGRENWKPRYCPMCATEDADAYGEPYYHLSHQIPMVSVCQKHHCKLKLVDKHLAESLENPLTRALSFTPRPS